MSNDGEPPPAPQIHSKGVVATDITGHFIKATGSTFMPQPSTSESILAKLQAVLNVGQLIKDDYFTLFESVGAIEVDCS
jgi:hypothetical protein